MASPEEQSPDTEVTEEGESGSFLQKKIGPFPVYVYGVVIIGGAVVFFIVKKQRSSGTPTITGSSGVPVGGSPTGSAADATASLRADVSKALSDQGAAELAHITKLEDALKAQGLADAKALQDYSNRTNAAITTQQTTFLDSLKNYAAQFNQSLADLLAKQGQSNTALSAKETSDMSTLQGAIAKMESSFATSLAQLGQLMRTQNTPPPPQGTGLDSLGNIIDNSKLHPEGTGLDSLGNIIDNSKLHPGGYGVSPSGDAILSEMRRLQGLYGTDWEKYYHPAGSYTAQLPGRGPAAYALPLVKKPVGVPMTTVRNIVGAAVQVPTTIANAGSQGGSYIAGTSPATQDSPAGGGLWKGQDDAQIAKLFSDTYGSNWQSIWQQQHAGG